MLDCVIVVVYLFQPIVVLKIYTFLSEKYMFDFHMFVFYLGTYFLEVIEDYWRVRVYFFLHES